MAESGIMRFLDVDTAAAPTDEPDLPLAAIELVAELRTDSSESCVAVSVAAPVLALASGRRVRRVVVELVDASAGRCPARRADVDLLEHLRVLPVLRRDAPSRRDTALSGL